MIYDIATISGDGIGPEIISSAKKVLTAIGKKYDAVFNFEEAPMGGIAIDTLGTPMPQSSVDVCKKASAVLLGAVGGPKWDNAPVRPEKALLGIRKELGLDEKDFIVLSVGELNKNKNQKVVIEAVGQLRDKNIKYILCGKGAMRQELENTAEKCKVSGQVYFLGYRKDVVDICSQSDIFAFPSYREGLGLASLEAMYSGLPLVASGIRGIEDYVENGKNGFLCSPDDSQEFADAICRLKDDTELRKKCGENNRKAVVPYCLDHVKEEVVKLFE